MAALTSPFSISSSMLSKSLSSLKVMLSFKLLPLNISFIDKAICPLSSSIIDILNSGNLGS
ncbi:hypothetical protein D3C73_855100 [compost metagenome]